MLPRRASWLCLLSFPSAYFMVMGLLVTLTAKALVLRAIEDVSAWPLVLISASSLDLFFYLGLAALFSLFERRARRRVAVTMLIAVPVVMVAIINGYYLYVTGEQLTWEAVRLGLDRWDDTWTIFKEGVIADWPKLLLYALFLAAIPTTGYVFLRRRGRMSREERSEGRARAAGPLALVGFLLFLIVPSSDSLPVRRLSTNAALMTYWTWVTAPDPVPEGQDGEIGTGWTFQGYKSGQLVTAESIADLGQRKPYNVLVVVLESTRYDSTSLPPESERRGAETPVLAKLAATGLMAPRARAVLPHTTKSLVSILCGRYPAMQKDILETHASFQLECLPSIATRAGYRSAFFQSSVGAFEFRPRLASMLGYAEFFAWESVLGEALGYLASDDESLGPAFDGWLASLSGERFFATVLTSAAHHPYRLGAAARERATASGAKVSTDEDRYQRLVESEDHMIGALVAALEKAGVREKTIIVVVGDHGEGFGVKGVRQHDNNFYEEGLRVPFVINAPGLAARQVQGNVSLLDVVPTVLSLLGMPLAPAAAGSTHGLDLSRGDVPPDRPHYFSCWFEQRCEGVIIGNKKLVRRPMSGERYLFDLDKDPQERLARPVPNELAPHLKRTQEILDAHRAGTRWRGPAHPAYYGEWKCPPDRGCFHPNTARFRGTDMLGPRRHKRH